MADLPSDRRIVSQASNLSQVLYIVKYTCETDRLLQPTACEPGSSAAKPVPRPLRDVPLIVFVTGHEGLI
jgi:hypothetical protein